METQVTKNNAPATINGLLAQENIKKRFEEILGDNAASFISSVISATKANPMLANCEPNSVISSAVIAATLNLPIQNNLGFAAIVPYNSQSGPVAQFQMMYKGFIQLAWRTGQYKTINAAPIYAGELVNFNRITGEVVIDETKKTSDEIIGYCAFFKLMNGAEKYFFMNVGQVREHGEKYSKSFKNKNSRWQLDFPSMALKTVLKMLLSKYGILSVEMQKSLTYDESVVKDIKGDHFEYVDSTVEIVESKTEEVKEEVIPNSSDL
jgi:recombination protein RecT